MDFLLLITYR